MEYSHLKETGPWGFASSVVVLPLALAPQAMIEDVDVDVGQQSLNPGEPLPASALARPCGQLGAWCPPSTTRNLHQKWIAVSDMVIFHMVTPGSRIDKMDDQMGMLTKNYQLVFAFVFAIHEININENLLPNTTLQTYIYDNEFNSLEASSDTLDLLSMGQRNTPNYKCVWEKKLIAIIGGLTSPTSLQIANILNIYKIPQVEEQSRYGLSSP
ncbi:hypothetical protein JD844_001244 [Phrynosoma platyrhinos]|uniref:Receptor ligand binding region domain-containing protein n=1 Tax=Phrynosoma platyrhinos TaxID=52577 RepID=A0ABQ7TA30_PHRPL|nr:hypothetical protein JD844_001244 [Phrynosoma platyrhinos]